MNTYEIRGYYTSEVVAEITAVNLDDACAWAKENLGKQGWSTVMEKM